MITLSRLVSQWNQTGKGPVSKTPYHLTLSEDQADIFEHLTQLYPRLTREQLLQDLLCYGLDKLEASIPYVKGQKVIARDEEGDALYEDIGKTPKLLALTQKHRKELMRQQLAVSKP